MFPSRALSTTLLVAVVASPALTRAEDATVADAAESAALLGGYRVGDGVVALVDWEGTSGRVAQGEAGTVSGPGQAPNTLACAFSGVSHELELPLAQLGNRSAVLNGGYRIGDKVASLIAWENNGADIARGDVGIVLDSGREDKGLVVNFPRMRRISILLTQVGKMGTPLAGDYSIGDKVVSLISWSGSAGRLAVGDVGVALASGNGGRGVVADFPNIKNLNIQLQQISKELSKAEVEKSAAVADQHDQQEQELSKAEVAKSAAEPSQDNHQEQAAGLEEVLTKKASSLSQKLADAARRFSIGKKLQKAKANRDDSELETKPVKRLLVQADAWQADPKESLVQRLIGPLLGKKRAPPEDEVEALSLVQTSVQLSKKSLLSSVKWRHDEF